jgi:NMD protein affecting ribosome stability and mRNA decay
MEKCEVCNTTVNVIDSLCDKCFIEHHHPVPTTADEILLTIAILLVVFILVYLSL